MTEIFGTFGPSCSSQAVLADMLRCGMTGIRLNLSHCDLADSEDQIAALRAAEQQLRMRVQLVVDAQGPELRIGDLRPLELTAGDAIGLGTEIPVPTEVLIALEHGDQVLLDDGKIALQVIDATTGKAVILRGGVLTGRKSIKLVGKQIRMPVLTDRDLRNLRQCANYGVTGLLQPFVHSGAELQEVRRQLDDCGAGAVQIFAKIETLDGVRNLKDILPYADVIVIARGDLGNDMPLWKLPAVQKEISSACLKAGKPFIVVTQMLATMEHSAVPTRAEVSDIFNAVADGAWGVMLTGETAVGEYPTEAIRYLTNTAAEAEAWRRNH